MQSNYTLYPHQQKAVDAVFSSWNEFDRTLFVAPTGVGKTIIFSDIADKRIPFGPVLVLAHRDELLDQAIDKIHKARGLFADKEKAEQRASLSRDIVVGSVQTLCRDNRLSRFPLDHFKTIIVDEAHRTLAKSYLTVLDQFPQAKVLGVTATPDRGDKKNLSQFYQDIAHEILLKDMIRQGWLSKIMVQNVPLEIDLSGVSTRGGDYSEEEVAARLEPLLELVADSIVQYASDRKTLVFVPLVATGAQFAAILKARGLKAEHVHGESPDRKEIRDRFASGETKIVVNAMLWTEGFDEPSIDCVVVLRPTRIRSLFAQMVGRGTRVHPGKANLLLLDYLWLTERHDLVKPAALIADTPKHQEEIEAEYGEGENDLLECEGSAIAEREASLARELARNRKRKGRTIDLLELSVTFQFNDALLDYEPVMPWHNETVSPKQAAFLEKQGLDLTEVRDRGHASLITGKLLERVRGGLASPKQIRVLQRNHYPGDPLKATFEEASRFIDRVSLNWRR
jgi:superfamily II DNA or RNA helicase